MERDERFAGEWLAMDASSARRAARVCAITLALFVLIAAQAGCTVVTIHDSEGFTRVERDIGFTRIVLAPSVSATVTEVRSFGIVSGPMGVQAGFFTNKIAAASADCRVILWVETAGQLDAQLWQQIEQAKNVCLVDNREKQHASNPNDERPGDRDCVDGLCEHGGHAAAAGVRADTHRRHFDGGDRD